MKTKKWLWKTFQNSARTLAVWPALSALLLVFFGSCQSAPPAEAGPGVKDFFAGAAAIFIVSEDGSLWSAGYNRSGQLGLANSASGGAAPGIVQIQADGAAFTGVKSVASGENHTLILKDDGTLWAAGESLYGELGLGGDGKVKLEKLTRLEISGVKSIAAGNNSAFIIKDDGTLWAAGYNYYGELGLGDRENRVEFSQVNSAGNDVKEISSGARHTIILKNDGSVWAAGYNFNGQLGLGTESDVNVFTRVDSMASDAASAAAGNYHTLVLKKDGSVWAAGENYFGQLGWNDKVSRKSFEQTADTNGGPLSGASAVAARGNISLVLKNDNSLLFAGSYADPAPRDEFRLPPEDAAAAVVKPTFAPLEVDAANTGDFKEVKRVVLGNQGIYIITNDNRLWAAGSNRYGQLNLDYDTETLSALRPVYP